jgi:hypothetical protein
MKTARSRALAEDRRMTWDTHTLEREKGGFVALSF